MATFAEQVAGARHTRTGVFQNGILTLSWGDEGVARILTRDVGEQQARAAYIPGAELERVLLSAEDIEEGWMDQVRKRDFHRIHCVFEGRRGQRFALAADALAPLTSDLPEGSGDGDVVPLDALRECVMTAIVLGAELETGTGLPSAADAPGHPYRAPESVPPTSEVEVPLRGLEQLTERLDPDDREKVVGTIEGRFPQEIRLGFCQLEDEGFEIVAPMIEAKTSLRDVSLLSNRLTAKSVARIIELLGSNAVRRLGLGFNPIGDEGLRRILRAADLSRLERLDVGHCAASDRIVEEICDVVHSNLKSLDVSGNDITAAAARMLASHRALERLTMLDLASTLIGAEGLAHIAASKILTRLARLDVEKVGLVETDVAPLLEHDGQLEELTALNLAQNQIGTKGAKLLSRASFLPRLTRLNVRKCRVGDEGFGALLSRGLDARYLNLSHNELSAASVEKLFSAARRVDFLVLSGNPIGDAGAEAVARSEHAKRLDYLYVNACELTSRGRETLERSPHLSGLKRLDTGA